MTDTETFWLTLKSLCVCVDSCWTRNACEDHHLNKRQWFWLWHKTKRKNVRKASPWWADGCVCDDHNISWSCCLWQLEDALGLDNLPGVVKADRAKARVVKAKGMSRSKGSVRTLNFMFAGDERQFGFCTEELKLTDKFPWLQHLVYMPSPEQIKFVPTVINTKLLKNSDYDFSLIDLT